MLGTMKPNLSRRAVLWLAGSWSVAGGALAVIGPGRAATASPTPSATPDLVGHPSSGAAEDLRAALNRARSVFGDQISASRYSVMIDYRLASSTPRLYIDDAETGAQVALLVAHGRGSDPDHDGLADQFSDTPNSKMTSLGAFLTGKTYHGAHGLSLRLHGLEPSNANAFDRAIVMHGADYVAPGRAILGRSWGCPALEQAHAQTWIPRLAGGALLVAVG